MRSPLGFVIPDGCRYPKKCRPEYQEYDRQAGWYCVGCARRVRPQPDVAAPFTAAELSAIRCLSHVFSNAGFGTCWRDAPVIGCKLEGVDSGD